MGKGYYEEVVDSATLKNVNSSGLVLSDSYELADASQLKAYAEQMALHTMAENNAAAKLYSESDALFVNAVKDANGKVKVLNGDATAVYQSNGKNSMLKMDNVNGSGEFAELKNALSSSVKEAKLKNLNGQAVDLDQLQNAYYKVDGLNNVGQYIQSDGSFVNAISGQYVEAKDSLIDKIDGQYVNAVKDALVNKVDTQAVTAVDTLKDATGEFELVDATDKKISIPIDGPGGMYVETKKISSSAVDEITAKVDTIQKDIDDIKAYVSKLNAPNSLDLFGDTLNTFSRYVRSSGTDLWVTKNAIKEYEDEISEVEDTYSKKYDSLTIPNIKESGEISILNEIVEPIVPTVTIAVPTPTGTVPVTSPTPTSSIITPTLAPIPTSTVIINPPTTPIPIGTVPLYELPPDDSAYLTPTEVSQEIGRSTYNGYSGAVVEEPEPEPEPEPVVEPVTTPPMKEAADITFVPDISYDEPIEEETPTELPVNYIQEETPSSGNSGLKIAGGLALAAGATLGTFATAKAVKDKKGDSDDEDDDDDDDDSYSYGQYSRRYGDR